MQDASAAVPKNRCLLHGRCRPPRGWAGSSPALPPGTLHSVGTGHLDGFQRTGNRLQMAPGQMQIEGSISDLGMAEKNLDGAQVGARLQQMRCKAMP